MIIVFNLCGISIKILKMGDSNILMIWFNGVYYYIHVWCNQEWWLFFIFLSARTPCNCEILTWAHGNFRSIIGNKAVWFRSEIQQHALINHQQRFGLFLGTRNFPLKHQRMNYSETIKGKSFQEMNKTTSETQDWNLILKDLLTFHTKETHWI